MENKITSTITYDYSLCCEYKYKKEIKFFGIVLQKEGFYYYCHIRCCEIYYGKNAPKNHKIIDGLIYEMPHLVVIYENGQREKHYFDKVEEALDFAKKINFLKKNLVIVCIYKKSL